MMFRRLPRAMSPADRVTVCVTATPAPNHSTQQGLVASDASHESSVAHLGQMFYHFVGFVPAHLIMTTLYQMVVINCVHKPLRSEIIAGRNRPKSALRTSRTRRLDGDVQERSLVPDSTIKDDPSDPVYGSKQSS